MIVVTLKPVTLQISPGYRNFEGTFSGYFHLTKKLLPENRYFSPTAINAVMQTRTVSLRVDREKIDGHHNFVTSFSLTPPFSPDKRATLHLSPRCRDQTSEIEFRDADDDFPIDFPRVPPPPLLARDRSFITRRPFRRASKGFLDGDQKRRREIFMHTMHYSRTLEAAAVTQDPWKCMTVHNAHHVKPIPENEVPVDRERDRQRPLLYFRFSLPPD